MTLLTYFWQHDLGSLMACHNEFLVTLSFPTNLMEASESLEAGRVYKLH